MKSLLIIFHLLLISTFAFAQEESQKTIIKDYLLTSNNNDLKFLDETINDVQVLALGESTHGTKEFNLMYLKMFKYLVEEHNFTTLFLEDEYSRCLILDQYIKCTENCDSVSTKILNCWPWRTKEMNELVEWMRNYNRSSNKGKLSIVGIDIQDSQHICFTLNQILQRSNQDTLALPTMKKYFTEKDKIEQVKKYSSAEFIEFYKEKSNTIENSSRTIYAKLMENLEWNRLLSEIPNRTIRDLAMGKNVLAHLESFPKCRAMLIAHNGHIAKVNDGKKNEIKSRAYAGGVIEKKIGEKYFAIIQEFDEGCFNAYSKIATDKPELGKENIKNYKLDAVCIEKSTENSIGSIMRTIEADIVYITGNDLFNSTTIDKIKFHHIGALFIAEKDNPNQTRQFFQLIRDERWFDAIIFHRLSTPTTLIER